MADRQSSRRSRIAETRDDLSAITSFAHGLAADLALAETDTGMLSMRGDAVILTVPDKSVFGRAQNPSGTDLSKEIDGVRCLLDEIEKDLRVLASGGGRR